MALTSQQGVALAAVERRVPEPDSQTASDVVDEFDPAHHHLVWSQSSGVEVRTPRLSMLVASPVGLWVPGGHPYTVEASAPWWTARFGAESCPPSWRRLTTVDLDDVVGPMLAHLHRHPTRAWSGDLVSSVVAHLEQEFLGQPVPLRFPTDPRAREVAESIIDDPASQRDLNSWAEQVGASERTLRRLFAEQTGLQFGRWRTQYRMHLARRLLSDGTPVDGVARRCGYGSTTAFSRAFVNTCGLTPAGYQGRAGARGEPGATDAASWPFGRASRPVRSSTSTYRHAELLDALMGEDMTGRSRVQLLAIVSALLLMAAACGSDDDDEADATVGEPSSAASASTETTAVASDPGSTDLVGDEVAETRVFVDDLGREVEVPVNPERVIFANGELAGMVTTLGYEPLALHDSYGSDIELLRSFGGLTPGLDRTVFLDSAELNLEALKALEPDLLIWTNWLDVDMYEVITEEIAPVVALDPRTNGTNAYAPGEDQGETYSKQRKVADLVGVSDALDEQIAEYEAQIDAVRERHGELIDQLEWTMLDIYGDGLAWLYGNPVLAYGQVFGDLGLDRSTAMTDEVESPDAEYYLQTSISAERVVDFGADLVFVLVEDPSSQSVADVDSGIDALLSSTGAGAAGQVFVGDQLGWTLHSVQANVAVLDEIDQILSQNEIVNVGDF